MKTVPYHPNETCFGEDSAPVIQTGLFGAVALLYCALVGVVAALLAVPFVVLGFAEFVAETPTHWRVRWIRREDQS